VLSDRNVYRGTFEISHESNNLAPLKKLGFFGSYFSLHLPNMDFRCPAILATLLIFCVLIQNTGAVSGYVDDPPGGSARVPRCPKCKSQGPGGPRVRRDTTQMITDLAREFVARGGLQSVMALMQSNDKMATLKSILGQQVSVSLMQGILNKLGAGGGGGGGGGGRAPTYGPPSSPPGDDGRWDPAPTGGSARPGPANQRPASGTAGGTANPDDTEY